MRYAILSDIHANVPALRAVLADVRSRGADVIVSLGDLVGYGDEPNECVEILRDHAGWSVCGNHDLAAVDRLSPKDFGGAALRSYHWTRRQLTGSVRAYLASLPISANVDGEFLIVHAALHPRPNAELHLSNRARVGRSLRELSRGRLGSRLCFFGHTHRPIAHVLNGTQVDDEGPRRPVVVRPEATYLINPGSVGQSRDRDARAAYALYDSAIREVTFHRVAYHPTG